MYPLQKENIEAMFGLLGAGDYDSLRTYAQARLAEIDAFDDKNPIVCDQCGGKGPAEEAYVYYGDTYCLSCANSKDIPVRWRQNHPRHKIATEIYCLILDLNDELLDDDLLRGRIQEASDNLPAAIAEIGKKPKEPKAKKAMTAYDYIGSEIDYIDGILDAYRIDKLLSFRAHIACISDTYHELLEAHNALLEVLEEVRYNNQYPKAIEIANRWREEYEDGNGFPLRHRALCGLVEKLKEIQSQET